MKKKLLVIFMLGIVMLFSLVACGKDKGTGSMVVDDTFSIVDSGIVVTGKIDSGIIRVGDVAVIEREDGTELETKILGIESFRVALEEAEEGTYVGILVDVLDRNQVSSGDKLVVYGK